MVCAVWFKTAFTDLPKNIQCLIYLCILLYNILIVIRFYIERNILFNSRLSFVDTTGLVIVKRK